MPNSRSSSVVLAAARAFLQRNWQPIPIPLGEKGPRLKGWQRSRLAESDLPSVFRNVGNIGILLGEASGNLVDVDLDAPEALAVSIGLLPPTGRIHGRRTKPNSHWWYVSAGLLLPEKFADLDGTCIVELRSTGQQTIVPPSIHPTGEPIYWEREDDPATVDGELLRHAVARVAAASIFARHWPKLGRRHEAALAMHGLLLRANWTGEETSRFVGAVALAAGDEEWRSRTAHAGTTAIRLAENGTLTGRTRLSEIVGREVVDCTLVWLSLDRNNSAFEGKTLTLTDLGNAKRFTLAHGKDVRFCHGWKKWLYWDGQRWVKDEMGEIQERAKRTAIAMLGEGAHELDDERRKKLLAWQRQSEFEHRIQAQIKLAQSEEGTPVRVAELDRDTMLLNCQNGTLELCTGDFRGHRREDLITKLARVIYDASAECPRWLAFLNRVMGENKELVRFLQRTAGYALTGDTREHALFLFYGTGANGKTTFLEVLKYVLGDYAMSAEFSSFIATRGTGVRNDLARLAGARVVIAVESAFNRRLAEEVIKQVTGGDTITARFLYSEHFEFRPQFKIFLATNHKPRIRGTDTAIWRRIHLVPFTVTIPNEDQEKALPEKLREEASGILRWALEGLAAWRRGGLAAPVEVTAATSDYRSEQDVLQHFLDERCVPDSGFVTSAGDLYKGYTSWCVANGETPLCKKDLGMALQERGFRKNRDGCTRKWIGVKLSTEPL
jgi:P4 family phage/plasmid primase-like protien